MEFEHLVFYLETFLELILNRKKNLLKKKGMLNNMGSREFQPKNNEMLFMHKDKNKKLGPKIADYATI